MYDIDCELLVDAINFYSRRGYQMISVPLLVGLEASMITAPPGTKLKDHNGKYYVGSAEQSFYQMILDGEQLPPLIMAITPCHRHEEVYDKTHLENFLKLELLCTDRSKDYLDLAIDARVFFCLYDKVSTVKTGENSVDLEINGIEVGSYGERIVNGKVYAYGTGVALPRLSQATEYFYL